VFFEFFYIEILRITFFYGVYMHQFMALQGKIWFGNLKLLGMVCIQDI